MTESDKIIQELTGYLKFIEKYDAENAQDAASLHQYMILLSGYMSRANLLMADYKRLFREQKEKEYQSVMLSIKSQIDAKQIKTVLAKDYVESKCREVGYIYDLAERTSRTCYHTLEAVRSIVSSLKSERTFANTGS